MVTFASISMSMVRHIKVQSRKTEQMQHDVSCKQANRTYCATVPALASSKSNFNIAAF